MNRRLKKFFKRVSAVFLALVLVVTYVLYNSSDRVLMATSLPDEEEVINRDIAEEEELDENTVTLDLSEEQPEPEVYEPAPAEEPAPQEWTEPAPEEPAPAEPEPVTVETEVPEQEVTAEPEPAETPAEQAEPLNTEEPEPAEEPEFTPGVFDIAVSDTSVVYDGAPHKIDVVLSDSAGASLSYNPNGSGWQKEAPELTDVGSMRIEVRAEKEGSDPVVKTAVLEVLPREAVVTCEYDGKFEGDKDPVLTATVSGTLASDADLIQYTLARDPGEEPGTYAIKATGAEQQGNYTVRFEDGVFTIEAPEKPAQRLETTAEDGARIVVTAPAGTLPAGAYVKASVVSSGKASQAISSSLDEGQELVDVVVYDITIHAEDGSEIEPDNSVKVAIYGANLQSGESVSVYYIPESGGAEKIADVQDSSSLEFSADHFSEYAVATIQTAQMNENNQYEVAVGQSAQLPLPSSYYSGTWTSYNTSIVRVSSDGVITGVKNGEATVSLSYRTSRWNYSYKTQNYEISVTPGQPAISVSPGSLSFTQLGESKNLTVTLTSISSENPVVWTSSDTDVATVENGTVTAVGAGTAVITASVSPDEDDLYGNTYTDTASVSVNLSEYDLYHYALIPGADASSTAGNANTRWFGLGVSKILGAPAPSTMGMIVNDYQIGREIKALYPNLTYAGKTYKYAAAGTPEASEHGYYTLQPFRVVVASGANSGYNNYNTTVASGVKTYHLDYICVLNEDEFFSVNYAVQYPSSSQLEGLTDYAQRVREGTSLSTVTKPSASAVPASMTYNGISYSFDGWYTDSSFSQPADFSGTVTGNTTFYGHYVPMNARYRVEYYYDGVLDSSLTYISSPVSIGTEISSYTERQKTGFTLSSVEPPVLTVTANEADNIIRVYYTKRLISYTVNYYVNGTSRRIAPTVTNYVRFGETGTGTLLPFDRYTPVSDEAVKTAVIDSAGIEIRFDYYENCSLQGESGELQYNGQTQTLSGYTSSSGAQFEGITAEASGINAGTYTTQFGEDTIGKVDVSGQYIVTDVQEGTLTITPLNAVITAQNASKQYGQKDPAFDAVISGILPQDLSQIRYQVSRAPGEETGEYEMTVSGDTAQSNYTIEYRPGTFTISPSDEMTLSLTGYEGTYDGEAHTISVLPSVSEGTELSYRIGSGSWQEELPSLTDCGTATVEVRAVNPNYKEITGKADIVIHPAPVTVRADSKEKAYGTDDPELTASVSGLIGEDTVSFDVNRAAGEDVGEYAITPSGTAEQGNYTLVFEPAVLTITPGTISLSAVSDTKVYDGADLSGGVSGSLPEGTTVSYSTDNGETWSADAPVIRNAGVISYSVKAENKNCNTAYASGSLTVTPRKIVLTSGSAQKEYDGNPLICGNVTVNGTFAPNEGAEWNVTGSRTNVGSSENTFTYSFLPGTSSANYTVETVFGTLTVTNREAKFGITVKAADTQSLYDGTRQTASGLESVHFSINGHDYTVKGLSAHAEAVNAGTYPIPVTGTAVVLDEAGNDVTEQFSVSVRPGTFIIDKRNVKLVSESAGKTYDGSPLTTAGLPDRGIHISGDGFAAGEGVNLTLSGSQTLPGESVNTFTWAFTEGTIPDNYNIASEFGKLTVLNRGTEEKYQIVLEPLSETLTYDGEPHTVEGFRSNTAVLNGHTYTVEGISAFASGTDAGTYPVVIEGDAIVTDEDGNDVTSQFDVRAAAGSLVIARRTVTFTSATVEKEYDGTELRSDEVSVSGSFAGEEYFEFDVTGSQTLAGSSENAFTWKAGEGTKAENYNIETVYGTLTVRDRSVKYEVTVTAKGDTAVYDGHPHNAGGLDGTSFAMNGVTYNITGLSASASGTDAGTYPVVIEGTPAVFDSAGNNVSAQFAVNLRNSSLVIEKRNVLLTSGSATAEYTGDVLTEESVAVTLDGFAEGEGAEYTFTGGQALPGSSANTFEWKLREGTNEANYNITAQFGTLTITNRDTKYSITVHADSLKTKYDGTEQKVSGFKEQSFVINGRTYYVSGLTAEASATHAGTYLVPVTGTPAVYDSEGSDVTEQFAVETENGTLEITPRRITLRSMSAYKVYDGKPLTTEAEPDHGITAEGDSVADCDRLSFTLTGSRTVVGVSDNTFTWSLNGNQSDYQISASYGKLEVYDRTTRFEINAEASSDEVLYDGSEHSVSGFKTLQFNIDGVIYSLSGITSYVSGKDAGTYEAVISGEPVVTDMLGNDVTDQFKVNLIPGSLKITPRKVTLVSESSEKEYDGDELTAENVEVQGDGFAEGEGASFTVTGTQTVPGSSENTFTYELNEGTSAGNYVITLVPGNLTVVNRNVRYEITAIAKSARVKYDGTEHTAEGLIEETFLINGNSYKLSGLTASVTGTHTGTYTSVVTGTPVVTDESGADVTEQFAVRTGDGSLIIEPRYVTLVSADMEKVFDGNPLTSEEEENQGISAGGDGFVSGDGYTVQLTGTRTLPGTSDNSFTWTLNEGTLEEDYVVTAEFGTLTVTGRPADQLFAVTVRADSGSYTYDGLEHAVSGVKDTEVVVNGNRYTVTGLSAQASGVHAGTYDAAVEGTERVVSASGSDVTDQFLVTKEAGKLEITPRTVTITSATVSREYDGEPLTADMVYEGGEGFAAGEGADYEVTGSQTVVGSSPNTFTYTLKPGTTESDYNIVKTEGRLYVRSRDVKYEVSLHANSLEALYDGTEKTVSGVDTEFTIGDNTYKVENISAEASAVHAGRYPVSITGIPKVVDSEGNDVTGEFMLTLVPGTLQINKRNVTLTSDSASAEYTGEPLTASGVTVSGDGFAQGEGASFNVTGYQTLRGFSENTFTYTLNEGTQESDYVIRSVFGRLEVTNRSSAYQIEVRAKSLTVKYDGMPHSVSGFETTRFGIGNNVYTVSGLQAVAQETNAGSYTAAVTGIPTVVDQHGNDVTDQFSVTVKDGTLNILKRNVILTSADGEQVYNGKPLTNHQVAVGGDTFASGEGAVYSFSGSRTIVGSSPNTFTYDLSAGTLAENYSIDVSFGTLTVTARPEDAKYEVTVTGESGTVLYDGKDHTVSGIHVTGETGTTESGAVTFRADGNEYTLSCLAAEASARNAGTYAVPVSGNPMIRDAEGNDVTDQFIVHTASGAITVNKRTLTLESGSAEQTYTGKPLVNHNVTVTGDGFAEGEGVSYIFPAGRTLVGESQNVFEYRLNDGTDAGNYIINTVFGTLTVLNRDAKYVVTVTARSGEFLYDATEKSVEGLTASVFTMDGVSYRISGLSASGSGIDAGTYPVTVSGTPAVIDSNGNDVTEQFAVRTVNGSVLIHPRSLVFTSDSISAPYSGKALEAHGVTVTGDGFAGSDTAEFTVTGRRTLVGVSENTFTWQFVNSVNPNNYTVETVFGTISVTGRDAKYEITLQANSDEVLYDGNEHEVSGFETLEFTVEGSTYTVEGIEASVSATEPGIHTTVLSGTPVVRDSEGNDVTSEFAVTVLNGTLTIRDTYLLTIRYVDENGTEVSAPYTGRYEQGAAFGPVRSPAIAGMTPSYRQVVSGPEGMPARDVTVTVVYRSDAVPPAAPAEGPGTPTPGPEPEPEITPTPAPEGGPAETPAPEETQTLEDPERETTGAVTVGGNGEAQLVDLGEQEIPLANAPAGYWALINLVAAIGAVLLAIAMLAARLLAGSDDEEEENKDEESEEQKTSDEMKNSEEEEEDKESRKRRTWAKVLTVLTAAASVIVFLLTEDMTKTMRIADRWTIIMIILLIIEVVLVFFALRTDKDNDQEEENLKTES